MSVTHEEIKNLVEEIHKIVEIFDTNRKMTDNIMDNLHKRLLVVEKEIRELKRGSA